VSIRAKIREIRLPRGLVIVDIAPKTGLSKPYISQVQTRKVSRSLRTPERITQTPDIPLSYLFLGDTFAREVGRGL
jgi:transcriptional regulator with XRE-family HTH domain